MQRLDLQTPDFVAANAVRLAEIFPNCVSETRNPQTGEIKRAIDFDLLRQELAYDIVEGPQERYRLDWPGKREALAPGDLPREGQDDLHRPTLQHGERLHLRR
jgi:adenine-specific DNA-methyltransferase